MAVVTLHIGDNRWSVGCRDGEERQLERLGAMIADRWPGALRAAGSGGTTQALLLAALMLADDLLTSEARPLKDEGEEDALVALATRLETLATQLEQEGAENP